MYHQNTMFATELQWPDSVFRVVICVGAQKAATTFLHENFAQDRRIHVPKTKEVHYWDSFDGSFKRFTLKRAKLQLRRALSRQAPPYKFTKQSILRNLGDELALAKMRLVGKPPHACYRDYLLRGYNGEPVIFESTPNYALSSSLIFRQMAAISNETRILLVMRDPVERMWSAAKYLLKNKVRSGSASIEDVRNFYLSQIRNPTSSGFRHSAYELTLQAIEQAGVADQLCVLFFETLASEVENGVLCNLLGLAPMLNHKEKKNSHEQHFPLEQDLLDEGIEAFSKTYRTIHERYSSRVPDRWHA